MFYLYNRETSNEIRDTESGRRLEFEGLEGAIAVARERVLLYGEPIGVFDSTSHEPGSVLEVWATVEGGARRVHVQAVTT